MALTKYNICSRAAVRTGIAPITSFEDGTAEAIVAGDEYEDAIEYLLTLHRWRFATQQFSPTRLTEVPTDEWSYYWQIPSSTLIIHTCKSGGRTIKYDRYEDKIACDVSDGLVIDHTFRVSEARWPPYFVNLATEWMQAIFAGAVRRDFELAQSIRNTFEERTLPRARVTDSQQQTAKRISSSPFIAVRG